MYRSCLVFTLVVVACGAPQTPAPPPPPPVVAVVHVESPPVPPPFQPTSFVDTVSGRGRPVILIPGLGCPGDVWDDTVVHLVKLGAETHVLELAGMAGQPAIAGPLNATVRAELAQYIRDRGFDHPVVIGHSMGGFIAYWLAALEPDLLGPVIIVDAAPSMGGDAQSRDFAQTLGNQWRTSSDADFARGTADFFSGMGTNRVKLAPVIAAVARSDKRAFADAFYELFATDIRPDLAATRAPMLVVLADTGSVPDVTAQTAVIPDHEIVVIPRTRHFVFFDDAEGWFRVIDRFLTKHPAP